MKKLSFILALALIFNSFIGLQYVHAAGFGYYKTMTIDATQAGTADSTNYPLTVALDGTVQAADTDLKTTGNGGFVQSASGYDIRPYSDAALTSTLTYQLVFYDATTGKLEMHILIPTLSHTSNTVIYLAFGNASLTTDGSSNSTWNSSYKGVWHLPNGSSLTTTDSTSNTNNGTNHNATAVAGEIDGGGSFNGTTAYVDMGTTSSLNFDDTNFSVCAWIKPAAVSVFPVSRGGNNLGGSGGWGFRTSDFTTKVAADGNNAYTMTFNTVPTLNVWSLICATGIYSTSGSSGSAFNLYLNGALDNGVETKSAATGSGSADNFEVGARSQIGGTPVSFYNGILDEVRISSGILSASWILSDYNAQKPSSTFIAWGSKVPIGSSFAFWKFMDF